MPCDSGGGGGKGAQNRVTDAAFVQKAIDECDRMGRLEFREHYGFGEARSYFVRHNGKTYDSKAIVGVAFSYEHNTEPLRYDDFSGGAATVKPVLERLGYACDRVELDDDPPPFRSEWLEIGDVYTRDELREIFGERTQLSTTEFSSRAAVVRSGCSSRRRRRPLRYSWRIRSTVTSSLGRVSLPAGLIACSLNT